MSKDQVFTEGFIPKYLTFIQDKCLMSFRVEKFIKEKLKEIRENIYGIQYSDTKNATASFTLYNLKGQEEILINILNEILSKKFSPASGDEIAIDKIDWIYKISFEPREIENGNN